MSAANTAATIRQIELDGGMKLLGLRLDAKVTEWGDVEVICSLTVPLRDDPTNTGPIVSRSILSGDVIADRDILRFVREVLKKALEHELDESITLRGRRPFDPHATEAEVTFRQHREDQERRMSDEFRKENNALRKNNERLSRENADLRAKLKLAETRARNATMLAQGWRLKIAELRGEDIGELQLSELKPPE